MKGLEEGRSTALWKSCHNKVYGCTLVLDGSYSSGVVRVGHLLAKSSRSPPTAEQLLQSRPCADRTRFLVFVVSAVSYSVAVIIVP